MANQSLTLSLPEDLFKRLQQLAENDHRSVEEEAAKRLAASMPEDDELPPELRQLLDSMPRLDVDLLPIRLAGMGFHLRRRWVSCNGRARALPPLPFRFGLDLLVLWLQIPQALRYRERFFFSRTKPEKDREWRLLPIGVNGMGLRRQKFYENLLRAAHNNLARKASAEINRLRARRQRQGLTVAEQQRLGHLLRQYDRSILIRSHALALLKQRGHDITPLLEMP